jgi:hypothetical protein
VALNPKLSASSRNAALDAALNVMNTTGSVKIYDNTIGQPTDADTALSTQILLASNAMAATAWGAASAGSKTAGAFTAANAVATGTTTWYSFFNNTTRVWDGTCGTSGANLNFNSVAISSGASFNVTSFTATMAP